MLEDESGPENGSEWFYIHLNKAAEYIKYRTQA